MYRYTQDSAGLREAMAAGDVATFDAERRARLVDDWHRRGICTAAEPAHDCPCDRPKGGE